MLGTVQFGMPYGVANRSGQPSYQQVLEMLRCAHEGGVTALDTAAAYGESEKILGRALAELGLAASMTVVTKVPAIPAGLEGPAVGDFIRQSVHASLRNLRLETLRLCLFHREEDWRHREHLFALQSAGLVAEVGVSVMTPGATDSILRDTINGVPRAIQIPLNVLDHRFRRAGLLELTAKTGTALFVRSVYLQGLLLMPQEQVPAALGAVLPVRRRLEQLAREAGLELAELAVRYVLSLPAVTSVLVGVDTVTQLRQNLQLFERGPLPAPLVGAVEAAVPELPDLILRPDYWPRP